MFRAKERALSMPHLNEPGVLVGRPLYNYVPGFYWEKTGGKTHLLTINR